MDRLRGVHCKPMPLSSVWSDDLHARNEDVLQSHIASRAFGKFLLSSLGPAACLVDICMCIMHLTTASRDAHLECLSQYGSLFTL
jgi:hypothetical protein